VKKRIAPNTGSLAILSLALGSVFVWTYDPASEIISAFLAQYLKEFTRHHDLILFAAMALAASSVVYLISFIAVSDLASKIYRYIIGTMSKKQLLPLAFKPRTRFAFKGVYSDMTAVINSLADMLQSFKKDKDKFEKTVELYLDPIVKQEIDSRGIHEVYIGGKKRTATIFFSDLRGFTSFTETHEPDKVVEVLNEYLSVSTKIIDKYKGRVNKYIGDAVMAVFEEPPKYSDYVDYDKAVMASLEIRDNFERMLSVWKEKIDPLMSVGLGIGLARGVVISGNIGSSERMEHTVIGDKVNFASRLCSTAKNGEIIISDDIYSLLMPKLDVETLAPCEIKGKAGTHNIYSVKTRRMLER
jgi:class 3 adenylate cyclase